MNADCGQKSDRRAWESARAAGERVAQRAADLVGRDHARAAARPRRRPSSAAEAAQRVVAEQRSRAGRRRGPAASRRRPARTPRRRSARSGSARDLVGGLADRAGRGSGRRRRRPGTRASGSGGSTRRARARRSCPRGSTTGSASITSATLIPSIRLENSDCIASPRADWPRMKPISASQMPLTRKSPPPRTTSTIPSADQHVGEAAAERAANAGGPVAVAGHPPGDRAGDPPAVEREGRDQVEDQHEEVDLASQATIASTPEICVVRSSRIASQKSSEPAAAIPIAVQPIADQQGDRGARGRDLELGARRVGVLASSARRRRTSTG